MKRGKWLGALFLALMMLVLLPQAASAADVDSAAAKAVTIGKNITGSLTETVPERWYSFELKSSGRAVLHASANLERINYNLYGPSGNLIWSKNGVERNSGSGKSRIDENLDLQKGTYYLCIDSRYLLLQRSYGKYVFRLNFTSAKETFAESNTKAEETISTANAISFGKTVRGQLAVSEGKDIFRFQVSRDGRVTLGAKAEMRLIRWELYDSTGTSLWQKRAYWNSESGESYVEAPLDLRAGTYYLAAVRSVSTGPYAFRLGFKKSAVTFAETAEDNNDSLDGADKISLKKTVRGLLALNNERDFYKFKVTSAGEVRVVAAAYTKLLTYKILDSTGETIWSSSPRWSSSTKKSRIDEKVSLSKGTYYFVAEAVGANTGRYLFRIS